MNTYHKMNKKLYQMPSIMVMALTEGDGLLDNLSLDTSQAGNGDGNNNWGAKEHHATSFEEEESWEEY